MQSYVDFAFIEWFDAKLELSGTIWISRELSSHHPNHQVPHKVLFLLPNQVRIPSNSTQVSGSDNLSQSVVNTSLLSEQPHHPHTAPPYLHWPVSIHLLNKEHCFHQSLDTGSPYLTIIHRDHHDYDVPVLHWCLAYNTNGLVHPAFYMSASPPGSLPGSSWCHWTGWPYEVAATTTGTQHQTLLQVLCHALQGNNNTVENSVCHHPLLSQKYWQQFCQEKTGHTKYL